MPLLERTGLSATRARGVKPAREMPPAGMPNGHASGSAGQPVPPLLKFSFERNV